jgi:hypothetical protein
LFAGQFAGAGDLHEVSRAALSSPPPAGAQPVRSAAGRAGHRGHRGTRPGGTPAAPGSAHLRRRRDPHGGAPAMGPGGSDRRGDGAGRRDMVCGLRPASSGPAARQAC